MLSVLVNILEERERDDLKRTVQLLYFTACALSNMQQTPNPWGILGGDKVSMLTHTYPHTTPEED